jgi:hypothetical protein
MSPIKVCTLTCARDYDMAKTCYSSLVRLSAQPTSMTVYHDGTLTPDQCAELKAEKGIDKVSNVHDSKDFINDLLKSHPRSREFCWQHPLNLKLLVLPALFGFPFRYLDSDILFIRRFTNLFIEDRYPLFGKEMHDSGYSGKFWQIKKLAPRGMPSRANTGVIQIPESSYSLDFIEWFLSKPELLSVFNMVEQTIYPMMVGVDCLETNLENIYMNSRPGTVQISPKTFAVHFLGDSRREFEKYKNFVSADTKPISAEHKKATELGWLEIVWRKVRRDLLKQ